MGLVVTAGAQCQCSFGVAPSVLNVLPKSRIMVENKPVANIMDNQPLVNVLPFGMCQTLSNPQVAAATAAKLGVLTPMPCIPVIVAPWAPGSPTVMCGGAPAVTNSSKLMCNWGGVISVINSGAMKTSAP